jgi:hypothetical protein
MRREYAAGVESMGNEISLSQDLKSGELSVIKFVSVWGWHVPELL